MRPPFSLKNNGRVQFTFFFFSQVAIAWTKTHVRDDHFACLSSRWLVLSQRKCWNLPTDMADIELMRLGDECDEWCEGVTGEIKDLCCSRRLACEALFAYSSAENIRSPATGYWHVSGLPAFFFLLKAPFIIYQRTDTSILWEIIQAPPVCQGTTFSSSNADVDKEIW